MDEPFPIFMLSPEQLESLLPLSAFASLDTAVTAACHAMNSDELYNDEESILRKNLKRSLEVVLSDPLDVLKCIRQWALDCLKDEALQALICAPLASPSIDSIKEEGDFQTNTRTISDRQARGILANAFFANCLDPMQNEKDEWNVGGLDWRQLLVSEWDVGIERMRCHLLYFEASRSIDNDSKSHRQIVFERIRYKPKDFYGTGLLSAEAALPPVGTGVVLHENVMENSPRKSTAFVNFANPNFGYGKFISSCTQEEILESCCPEFTIGMLWIGKKSDDEVVNVRNVRRFSTYSGYLDSFRCQGPVNKEDVVLHDILTLDACCDDHFAKKSVQRDLNKAYFAFRAHATTAVRAMDTTESTVISTGKWGCGAFGGVAAHKSVQQILAANVAGGVHLDFSAFGDPESCDIVLKALQEKKCAANTVAKALMVCKSRTTFLEDFLKAIEFYETDGQDSHNNQPDHDADMDLDSFQPDNDGLV